MSITENFHYFPKLPAELRLKIWEEALCSWTIWAPVLHHAATISDHRRFSMIYVWSAPHYVGLSSIEAWQLLKRSNFELFSGPRDWAKPTHPYLINPDRTTVYLGKDSAAQTLLKAFSADEADKFRHVAIRISSMDMLYDAVSGICSKFAGRRPALRTITIKLDKTELTTTDSPGSHLNPETVACFVNPPEHTEASVEIGKSDMFYSRNLVERYIGPPHPKLHVLDTDSPHHSV
ncbi:MAG: hypothetical protein M1820_007181 [Bogoriella megaspora]|nr:MAG: hypothetical protein M1820_007181 [Bogoriella megaspora]